MATDGKSNPNKSNLKFWGYRRENGRVGVRNHVVILPLDDLSNAACEAVANNIKGALALPHAYLDPRVRKNISVFARLPQRHVAQAIAQLADDLERVLAPIIDLDQRVVERRTVIAREGVAVAECVRCGEHVRGDNFVEQTLELGIRQADVVQRLEFLAEIALKSCPVTNIRAVLVLQARELLDQFCFQLVFERCQNDLGVALVVRLR